MPREKRSVRGVERLAECLLGRHVRDGAHGGAGASELEIVLRQVGGESGGRGGGTLGNLGEAEVENLGVSALRDENVRGLDVAMDDAFGVSGVESVGDFDGKRNELIVGERAAGDQMVERNAIEKFHGDEGLALVLTDVVNGTYVGMVEGRGGLGLAAKTSKGLDIAGEFGGKKLERNEAVQARIFSFVDNAHATSAEFFGDAVMRDGVGVHSGTRWRMVGRERRVSQ